MIDTVFEPSGEGLRLGGKLTKNTTENNQMDYHLDNSRIVFCRK
jgi:hypothetical protein